MARIGRLLSLITGALLTASCGTEFQATTQHPDSIGGGDGSTGAPSTGVDTPGGDPGGEDPY